MVRITIFAFLLVTLHLHNIYAEVDKDALPKVEEGFKINFFVDLYVFYTSFIE